MKKISILLADDHDLVRQGIRSLLEQHARIGSVIEARNGHEAVQKRREHRPDLVIMDYEMPNFSGIYAVKQIMKECPIQPIIMLSAHQSREQIMEGVCAGVRGFLPKEVRIQELLDAILTVADGGTWFKGVVAELIAPSLLELLGNGKQRPKTLVNGRLSPRETEVLKLLAQGHNARAVSEKLSISKRTVDVHKANIFKKMNFKNIAELVRYALKEGIVKV